MSRQKKIRVEGSNKTYVLESEGSSAHGRKIQYNGGTYVEDEVPPEFMIFEGRLFKRGRKVG